MREKRADARVARTWGLMSRSQASPCDLSRSSVHGSRADARCQVSEKPGDGTRRFSIDDCRLRTQRGAGRCEFKARPAPRDARCTLYRSGASSADLRFKVRGFSPSNARMHIEGKWDAVDLLSAEPLLVLPANSRIFLHARPLPAKPQTLECRSALRPAGADTRRSVCGRDNLTLDNVKVRDP